MERKGEVILITGSSGCLGQHIVKLLQERDDDVTEIRLFDRVHYTNTLGHPEGKKMTEILGDIRHAEEFLPAIEGVDCVIHTAAVTDIRLIPNIRSMDSINVDGTRAVINGCLAKNVPRLVFASSTAMVCGSEHIFFGSESTTPIPKKFMIGRYGETKCLAEDLVIKASGTLCSDGETVLRTVSLRPTPYYGEGDKHFIIQFMKAAQGTHNYYYRVRSLDERLQVSYVGNVAWAFVKAKQKLAVDQSISGEAFFITDDTPIIDVHEIVRPYLMARGFGISAHIIPYWLAWIFLTILCFLVKIMYFVIEEYDFGVPSVYVLNYVCSTFFYNRSKATLRLDYEPLYTALESRRMCMDFYRTCEIR